MIISISGMPGSGKSTVARLLAKKLGIRRYSMGDMRRELARRKGLVLGELNKIGESEDWTDREVDDYQKRLGETEDNFVVEGRTSFFLIPKSFKVFLEVNPRTGAERIFRHMKEVDRNEGRFDSVEDLIASLKKREESDRKRYLKYYKIDITDRTQYDLILDTTDLKPEQVVDKILEAISSSPA